MRRTIEPTWNVLYACFLFLFINQNVWAFQSSSDPFISINNLDISDCYAIGNKSYSQIQLEFSWVNLSSDASISFELDDLEKSIELKYPVVDKLQRVVDYLPLTSPQVISFDVELGDSDKLLKIYSPGNSISFDISLDLPSVCHSTLCSNGNSIGGKVITDNDLSEGLGGIGVTITDCDNSDWAKVQTNELGEYSFHGISVEKDYQIVFDLTNGNGHFEADSDGNNSTVRNVTGPSCNVDLILTQSNTLSSSDADVDIFVPCYVHGDPIAGTRDDTEALLAVPYNGGAPKILAKASDVGSLWGIAWDIDKQTMYTSAVLRRHSGYGPLGVAGLYKYSSSKRLEQWLDVSFGGQINFGDLTSNSQRGLSSSRLEPAQDEMAWSRVGRVGIGDLEISENGEFLYLTNLAEKKLVQIEIDSDNNPSTSPSLDDVKVFDIPSPCGISGEARPWGLSYKNGSVYVAVTCDASISGSASDLRAFIYPFNENKEEFGEEIIDFPLTYPKGSQAVHVPQFKTCNSWRPWNDDYSSWCTYNGYYASPQPIVSDIEFSNDGSMTIGIIDRSAYMLGADDLLPDGSGYEAAIASAGDILRAHKIGNQYFLESGGKSLDKTGSSQNNYQGPGGGEFYDDSYYLPNGELIHSELAIGALAIHEGLNEIVYTAVDPIPYSDLNFSGGLRWQSTIDGSYKRAMVLYQGTKRPFQGKSAGLGDLELAVRKKSTIEIGNFVWLDINRNGIQDACDLPLSGLHICLLNEAGDKLSETISDINGQYSFSSNEVSELKVGHKYFITFGCNDEVLDGKINTPFGKLSLTKAAENKLLNSDADVINGQIAICANISNNRNDYSFDAGFVREIESDVDVALRLQLSDKEKEFTEPGELIKYDIEVFNQGEAEICEVVVTDYLPNGLFFSPDVSGNENWTVTAENSVVTTLGCINSGESVKAHIYLTAKSGSSPDDWTNYAEVSSIKDVSGNDISHRDVDSKLDSNKENNVGSLPKTAADDYIDGDGSALVPDGIAETDQDNVDPARLEVMDVAGILVQANGDEYHKYGDTVKFNFVVNNQGSFTLDSSIVSVYLPKGFAFDPSIPGNEDWTLFPLGFVYADVMHLRPNALDTLCLFLNVKPGTSSSDWVLEGEVSQSFKIDGTDISLNDIDSPLNYNKNDNAGGLLNSPADNFFGGNGTAILTQSDEPDSDQDNADPEEVKIYDLALRKVISSSSDFKSGDRLTYTIEIHNQGNQSVSNVAVIDYGNPSLVFDNRHNDHFEFVNGELVYIHTEIITPDEILEIPISFIIANENGDDIINSAEISFFTDLNGLDLSDKDADSTPDAIPDNDLLIDDEIRAIIKDENEDNVYVDEVDFSNFPASITCDNFLDEDDNDIAPLPYLDLSLTKTLVNEPKKYGDTAVYIIRITNEGDISAKNTIVTDYLPSGLEFDFSMNTDWAELEPGKLVTSIKGLIRPNEFVEIPLFLTIKEDSTSNPFAHLNIAEITYVEDENGNNVSAKDIDSTPDASPLNDIAGLGINLSDLELYVEFLSSEGEDDHDPEPLTINDLSLTKAALNANDPFDVGDDVEYILSIKNEGNTAVEQVVIADYPPVGMGLSDNDFVGWLDNQDGSLLNVIQGPISPGEEVAIPIVLTILESARSNPNEVLTNNAEILQATNEEGAKINDFDSEPANFLSADPSESKEDDESSASIILLALTPVQCDSLVERIRVNVSVGNNCQTEILPEYIFAQGGIIPAAADIDRYEYQDTSGNLRVDSIIPSYFLGTCLNVTAYVQGCALSGSGSLIPYNALLCLEDKSAPVISCAPNDTISCLEASQRIFTGLISDCSNVDTLLLDEDIEEIASGPYLQRITRMWQVRDAYGKLSDICTQVIVVRRLDFVNQLSIPTDTTLSCDDVGGIDVVIPPSVSGYVTIEGEPLGENTNLCNTAAFYEDQVLVNSPCKKITLRTWTINEWRQGRDSILERVQMITVIDSVAPTVSGLPDTLRVNTSDNTCFANVNLPAINYAETCNPSSVKVDMFTPTGAFLDQNGGIVSLPVDTNQIFYTVTDACHHTTRDTLIVIVTDVIGPLTICQSSLSLTIPTSASNITVPADQFDINSLDACGGPVTKLVRHMDSTAFGADITFECDDIGDTLMILLQVSDELGNASTCMIRTAINGDSTTCVSNQVVIVDVPLASTHEVGGLVFSYLGVGIPGVEIRSSEGIFTESDNYGNYFLGALNADVGYDISAEYESDFGIGVSTLDLLKIQRHIIGIEPFGDKYREIAADVNNDGKVNALDLVILRKHILGFHYLDDSESWRFVSEENQNGPMGTHTISTLQEDTDVDFIGIKIGDVTGDAVDALLSSSRSKEQKTLTYDIIDLGGYREISFKATEDMSLSGLQLNLNYNSEILTLTNVSSAKLNLTTADYNGNTPGNLILSWASNENREVKSGDVLWRVLLESNSGNEWNYGLDFIESFGHLNSELYMEGETYDLLLKRASAPSEELSEVQNDPNPWSERTKLDFELPRSGMVELELYDAQNRLVLNRTKIFDAGNQKWTISNREISQGGVYFGKMSFEGKTRVFKMIKIE